MSLMQKLIATTIISFTTLGIVMIAEKAIVNNGEDVIEVHIRHHGDQ